MDKHSHEETKVNPPSSQDFVPPRHWVGPEELEASYWNDPKVQEKRGQEFFEKPVEWLDKIEKIDEIDKKGVARRDFLTIMGASMAMASAACARRPVHKIIPYVVKPEDIVPGVANWYASTCQECPCGCGILIRTREGRPIKLEGNPDHPISKGALCIQGQASLLNLYDPDRLKKPLAHLRADGSSREISWEDADAAIVAALKKVSNGNGRVRVLSGELKSESTRRLVSEFLAGFKDGKHVEYDPLQLEEIQEGQNLAYGTPVTPDYKFDQADYILSLGADFLGTGLSSTQYSRDWAKKRQVRGQVPAQAKISRMVCFESMMSLTGSNSDLRVPIRPGDEFKIALALANELLVNRKLSGLSKDGAVVSALSGYSVDKVATELGLHDGAAQLKQIVDELWANRGKGIVIGGSLAAKTSSALSLQIVINLLNSALENEGSTVDGTVNTAHSRASFSGMSKLISEMNAGQVDVLVIYRSNPAYTLPKATLGLSEALKKVPLVISVADRDDETGHFADYVLPDPHYLENWGDANPRKGLYSIQQPAIAPLHSTRAFQDSLIHWGKALDLKSPGLLSKSLDWHQYLQENWKETHYKTSGVSGPFDRFWEGVLRAGVYLTGSMAAKPSVRTFRTGALNRLSKTTPLDPEAITLALYPKVAIYDGKFANNAWLQELPDPISTVTWDNYLNLGPSLAKKLGMKEDDVVEIRSGDLIAELPVHVQPGLHPGAAAAAVGYGRRAVGKVGNQAGVDVYPFVQVVDQQLVFSGQPVKLRKTGKFYRLAATQWHNVTENRPIINDITLAEFRKNPGTMNHTDPHLKMESIPSLWPRHEYKGYRWGMAIDLNSCTGCGACVVACQAENNIPVVGRDQVRVSRQMHWLKIDRYYSGSMENPEVVFQPMLCQHCENAPCETVCPVLATVHDDEGVNVQVYNRCVGTRYCQNNCPYKVRRFNFFDHWKSYEGEMNLVWNPDVTVRTRGVMEKCTFCIQRVRDAKDKAKDNGERVKDGNLKTACQQTCATDAIVFGDINDPESRVSKLAASPQGFRVLEELNVRPSITYMTKIRNKAETAHASGGGHA